MLKPAPDAALEPLSVTMLPPRASGNVPDFYRLDEERRLEMLRKWVGIARGESAK